MEIVRGDLNCTHAHTHTHTHTHKHTHTHTEAYFIYLVFLRKCRNKTKNDSRIKTAASNKKWEHLYTNPKIIPDIPRKTAVAKFRLATGHDCLAKHLHRIGILPPLKCILCNHTNDDTDGHHLEVCPAVKDVHTAVEKYWRARLVMASVSNAGH